MTSDQYKYIRLLINDDGTGVGVAIADGFLEAVQAALLMLQKVLDECGSINYQLFLSECDERARSITTNEKTLQAHWDIVLEVTGTFGDLHFIDKKLLMGKGMLCRGEQWEHCSPFIKFCVESDKITMKEEDLP